MIKSKILKAATGVQVGDVIDNTESTSLPSTSDGVVVGKFKRGRTDKPFLVTPTTYQGLLGRDARNPSYNVIEDALNRGLSGVWVQRIGSSDKSSSGGDSSGGSDPNFVLIEEWVHDGFLFDHKPMSVGIEDGRIVFISDILIDGEYGGLMTGTAGIQTLDNMSDSPEYKESRLTKFVAEYLGSSSISSLFTSMSRYSLPATYPKGAPYIAFGERDISTGSPAVLRGLTENTAQHILDSQHASYYADPSTNKIRFQKLAKPVEIRIAEPSEQSIAFVEALRNKDTSLVPFNRKAVISYGAAFNHSKDIVLHSTLRACIPQETIDNDLKPAFAGFDFSGYVNPSSDIEVTYIPFEM